MSEIKLQDLKSEIEDVRNMVHRTNDVRRHDKEVIAAKEEGVFIGNLILNGVIITTLVVLLVKVF